MMASENQLKMTISFVEDEKKHSTKASGNLIERWALSDRQYVRTKLFRKGFYEAQLTWTIRHCCCTQLAEHAGCKALEVVLILLTGRHFSTVLVSCSARYISQAVVYFYNYSATSGPENVRWTCGAECEFLKAREEVQVLSESLTYDIANARLKNMY